MVTVKRGLHPTVVCSLWWIPEFCVRYSAFQNSKYGILRSIFLRTVDTGIIATVNGSNFISTQNWEALGSLWDKLYSRTIIESFLGADKSQALPVFQAVTLSRDILFNTRGKQTACLTWKWFAELTPVHYSYLSMEEKLLVAYIMVCQFISVNGRKAFSSLYNSFTV